MDIHNSIHGYPELRGAFPLWHSIPGVEVTKAPFVNFSVSKILDLAKVHVRFFESHSYLTGVTAAQLR